MKTVPDKCPFCESPIMVHVGNLLVSEDGGFATYECKTQIDVEWDDDQWRRVGQTDVCMIREIKLLTRQRNEAQERMNRQELDCIKLSEVNQELQSDVNELKELVEYLQDRIKTLKKAGNAMYAFINPPSPSMRTIRMDNLLQGWDDAKININ